MICYCPLEPAGLERLFKRLGGQEQEAVFYPVDLPALVHCERNGLDHRICRAFYDQELYRQVFTKVTSVLMDCLYDRKLFKEIPGQEEAEVNLLFVPFYELVCLYGGAILKIFEIEDILAQPEERSKVILEADLREKINFPVLEYGQVIEAIFPGKIELLAKPLWPSGLPVKMENKSSLRQSFSRLARRLYWEARSWQAWSFDRKRPKLYIASNTQGWLEIFEAAVRSRYFGSVKVRWKKAESLPTRPKQRIISRILPAITEKIVKAFEPPLDKPRFFNLVLRALEAYPHVLEDPLLGLQLLPKKPKPKGRLRLLLGRAPYIARDRAWLYQKYLEGFWLILQEYSDGLNIGLAQDMIHLHKSAILADLLLFGNQIGPQASLTYFQESGRLKRLPQAVSVGSNSKGRPAVQKASGPKGRPSLYYIPTNLNGHLRLGPNREAHDLVYWLTLKKTLQALAAMPEVELVFKAHPKHSSPKSDELLVGLVKELGIKVAFEPLEDLTGLIDLAVIDYCGQGLYHCLCAGIPVVYLDFAIKPFFKASREYLEKHLVWIESSFTDDAWLAELKQAVADLASGRLVLPRPDLEDRVEPEAVVEAVRQWAER